MVRLRFWCCHGRNCWHLVVAALDLRLERILCLCEIRMWNLGFLYNGWNSRGFSEPSLCRFDQVRGGMSKDARIVWDSILVSFTRRGVIQLVPGIMLDTR